MAVAVTADVPGRTEQQCQQIAAKIVRDGMLPEGWLDAPGRPENGWRVVNVVPSQQESEDFAREQLLPALRPQRLHVNAADALVRRGVDRDGSRGFRSAPLAGGTKRTRVPRRAGGTVRM